MWMCECVIIRKECVKNAHKSLAAQATSGWNDFKCFAYSSFVSSECENNTWPNITSDLVFLVRWVLTFSCVTTILCLYPTVIILMGFFLGLMKSDTVLWPHNTLNESVSVLTTTLWLQTSDQFFQLKFFVCYPN